MLRHGDAVMTTPIAGLMVYPVALPVASILLIATHASKPTFQATDRRHRGNGGGICA